MEMSTNASSQRSQNVKRINVYIFQLTAVQYLELRLVLVHVQPLRL